MNVYIQKKFGVSIPRIVVIVISAGLICLDSNAQSLDLSQCTIPLGMESGEIPDSDLTASSAFDGGNVGPQIGRVRVEKQGGAWCPKNQITSEAEEWIQIELHTVHVITSTETQGRFGNGQGQEFAESYLISYWRPQLNKWIRYRTSAGKEILKGNINTYLASKTELNPPIIASKIRILPYSYHRRTACMRVEIYGCPFRGGLLSYSMPQGSKRGENWEFYDHTYDGLWDGQNYLRDGLLRDGYLRDGLGQLVDGRSGPMNFKDDFYGPERGKGWVGWKNDSRNSTDPLEIIFNFDSVREFNAVNIHSSNQFTKDVQVFAEAKIHFSVGGKLYPGEPILYVTMEDCIFEDPKNVTIKLHHRIGQYVKIQLFWAAQWVLISEINFDSQPAMGNFTEEVSSITSIINNTKDTFETHEASRAVLENPVPINIANSIVDQSPTAIEDFTSTTIVITAVISSLIAIVLVLLLILAAFLVRHRLFAHEKIPPTSQTGSMHYGEVSFNSLGRQPDGRNSKPCTEFGYAAPVVILAHRDPKLKKSEGGQSLSRDYEQPSFSSFVGSNGNTASSNGGSSLGNDKFKKTDYYSCAPVPNLSLLANTDPCSNEYEYVLPTSEFGIIPVNQKMCTSPRKIITPSSPQAINRNHRTVNMRFRELGLPEISKRNLKMIRKLGDGIFGTVFIGELEMTNNPVDRRLVAVKHLLRNATEKDKLDFLEEVRLLSSLNDPNVTQVLGVSSDEEPYSVVLEFLELGDLCQFLRGNDTLHPTSRRKLSLGGLLHLGGQIASGMKFLECRNIVHRDLSARNCVVSRCLTVKISHFATDTDLYSSDYYRLDGKMPLPIRWMAWESLFLGKYSTKSDIWSFGVCLWEILTFCRQPYTELTDQEVIHNLRRLSLVDDLDPFELLEQPYNCPRDIYELMVDTWRRNDDQRPSFWEIHCFLMRKNLNYNIPQNYPSNNGSTPSSFVEHYKV